ncbi:MAG: fibronectin type III-like domain-contianing protein, partial [Rhodococcus sp. (in: high G+C Gram-positive bacteria)]
ADLTQDPLFAFGEGLSYTTIEYSDLQLERVQLGQDDVLHATVTLMNTGQRPATETVQAYISDLVTSATWANRELKAFTQATVQPGERVTVTIEIPVAACSIVNARGARVVEPGTFELLVGHSSRDQDLLRTTFDVRA